MSKVTELNPDNKKIAELESRIKRGDEAENLINNPLFKEAIVILKAEVYRKFTETKSDDDKKRYELWLEQKLINDFMSNFTSIVTTGNICKKELSRLSKLKEKLYNVF